MGKIIKKPILVLDLDGVAFVGKPDVDSIDTQNNTLGDFIEIMGGSKQTLFKVAFLNPKKLRGLIENACRCHGGVLFMTAGFWDEISVKQHFINYLNLSSTTADKILKAPFLNANRAHQFFPDQPLFKIPEIPKNLWLKHFLEENSQLKHNAFVVLDDNPKQILSFTGVNRVVPILATTHVGIKPQPFYQQTLAALRKISITTSHLSTATKALHYSNKGVSLKQVFRFFVSAKPHLDENQRVHNTTTSISIS